MRLEGIHLLLIQLPVSFMALFLFLTTICVIWVMRDQFELDGGYNAATSSQLGDPALIGAILVGMEVLKAGGLPPPDFWSRASNQEVAVLAGLGLGVAWWGLERPRQWGDWYHHLFVAPLYLLLLGITVPVVLASGTTRQIIAVCCCVGSWAGFVIFDFLTGRINQRQYLRSRGFSFKNPD